MIYTKVMKISYLPERFIIQASKCDKAKRRAGQEIRLSQLYIYNYNRVRLESFTKDFKYQSNFNV